MLQENARGKFTGSEFFNKPTMKCVNEISSAEVNEVTQGHWSNYNKKPWIKQDSYKGKKDSDKKPWYNKDQKPWNKDNKHQSKDKNLRIHELL